MNCFEKKRAKKRTSSMLPLEFSPHPNDNYDDSFEPEREPLQSSAATSNLLPRRCTSVVYAITYFVCMIVVDFTIEGTQNAFPELKALPYAMTLFQFGFCFFLPVAISRGKSLKNLPVSIVEVSPYLILSLVVFGSNVCKSASARYVSFPTKVIFRSTKLIPVMIVASILKIDDRTYGKLDFLAAVLLCAGAAGYSFGEQTLNDDKTDSYFGILLLTGSVLCDAFTPNIKQWMMHPTNANANVNTNANANQNRAVVEPAVAAAAAAEALPPSSVSSSPSIASFAPPLPDIIISDSSTGRNNQRVVARNIAPRRPTRSLLLPNGGGMGLSASSLMTNAYAVGCVGLLVFMTASNHLEDAIQEAAVSPHLFGNLALIGTSLSIAVFAQTRLIQESGAVTAVTVTTLREFVTVLLSYMIYPKIFSTLHARVYYYLYCKYYHF
eukprot:jgi/Psemu1/284750/fgenesh1_pg.63_\